jgi:hypothetical protein
VAGGYRNSTRATPHLDPLQHHARAGVDPCHRAADPVRHPDGPGAYGDRFWGVSHRDLATQAARRSLEESDGTGRYWAAGAPPPKHDEQRGGDEGDGRDRGDQPTLGPSSPLGWKRLPMCPEALGRISLLGKDADEGDWFENVLKAHAPTIHIPDPFDLSRQMDGAAARQDLARSGVPAEARCKVQRRTPISALEWNGLAGVQADANRERVFDVGRRFINESLLQIRRGDDGLPRRGEDAQRLVAAELDDRATSRFENFTSDVGESLRKLGGSVVPALLRE